MATLPDGTEYRQVLQNPADGKKHVTPDGRIWFAVHEGVVNDVVITTPLTIHWKGHTVCGNNIFNEVEEYKRINSARARQKIQSPEALSIPLADYIPKAPDATKNICFNFHVFQNSLGTGNFLASEASRLIQISRWTNQLFATVNPSTDSPNPMPAQLVSDTWIRFELNRIEFYQDDALNVSISVSDLQAAAVARNPSCLNQVNVYITAGTYDSASAFAQLPDATDMGLDSWVVLLTKPNSNSLLSPDGDYAGSGTLAHEFGHVLDLVHTYEGGGASADCNTADPDFLIDVFGNNPSDCFHLCSWPEGNLSPQGTWDPETAVTNNLMGGNQNNTWTSALQAAMMHRALTEKSVKRYVVTPQFRSAQFPDVYLRMDGSGVTNFSEPGAGTVNCQFGSGPWEKFRLEPQPDGSVAIGSIQFPNVYLRMDGSSVTQYNDAGSGTVNCQFGVGPWEKFRLEYQPDGTFAIASVQFPNVYLRMDGSGVTQFAGAGAGTVNCQFGVGPWEKFRFCPGS